MEEKWWRGERRRRKWWREFTGERRRGKNEKIRSEKRF